MSEGVGGDSPLATTENSIVSLWKNDAEDNEDGSLSGYRGRIGIYEVLDNTNDVQKLIIANATSNQIREQCLSDGMVRMQIDGLVKALRGETTIEEVMRVTKE